MAEQNSSMVCNINGKRCALWINPDASDLKMTPELIRFTADRARGKVFVWSYTDAMHTDMSSFLGSNDPDSSPDFLKGAASRGHDGKYRMVESHFLQSFRRGHLTNEERNILTNLLDQDWSWVNQYIEVTAWLGSYRKAMGI